MSEEDIPVITDREELYDKCKNMDQLFDKYYLPLLDKHFSKTYKLQQENKELKQQIIIMEKYFELINNISFDYDGYNDVAGLKGVIDELNRFANLGRACNITEPIYESKGVKFNILLQKLPEQKIGDDK